MSQESIDLTYNQSIDWLIDRQTDTNIPPTHLAKPTHPVPPTHLPGHPPNQPTNQQILIAGSMLTMKKTLKMMGQEGIHFNNSFVSTPMCCPSRSTLLTGEQYTRDQL